MNRDPRRLPLPAACLAACLAACSGDKPTHPPGTHVHADGTVHKDHETPAAGKPAADHEHGERKPLGPATVGEHTFEVVQFGDVKAGGELSVDLDFPAAKPLPVVRGWIGEEGGKGSMKVKFDKETDTRLHGHPVAPDTLPAGAKLWLEVETKDGTKKVGLALR